MAFAFALCFFLLRFSARRSVAATSAAQASAAVSGSGSKDGGLEYEEVHSHVFDNELLAVQWLGGHILMLLTSKFEVRLLKPGMHPVVTFPCMALCLVSVSRVCTFHIND
jgi:hypothetical protein